MKQKNLFSIKKTFNNKETIKMAKFINQKKLVAIIISFIMAMGIALVGLTGMTAYAATGTIGMGKEHAATVTLTSGGTDTATVASDVTEGQYMLYFDVSEPVFTGDDIEDYYNIYIDLSWSEGEETYMEYLSYNPELGMYFAMLPNIKGGDEITFSAYYDTENVYAGSVTGNAYLGDLAIGAFNDFDLGNVRLPAQVELQLTPASYLISVAPYVYEEPTEPFAPTYTVTINGESITLEADPDLSYTYTGVITVTDTVMATITGENAGDYAVDVRVYNYQEPIELPHDEAITMNYEQLYLFSYTATKSGYQKVEATANGVADAVFSLAEKSSDRAIVSTNYPELGYPLNLTAGHTYYFQVAYAGLKGVDPENPGTAVIPESVSANISVADWDSTTATLDEIAYVPVNETGDTYRAYFGTFDEESTYDISLAVFPNEFDFASDSMTLHLVINNVDTTYELNMDNNFSVTELDLADANYMYVNWNSRAVVGLVVAYTPIYGDITVNVGQDITLPTDRFGTYTVHGLEANKAYNITLTYAAGVAEDDRHVEISTPSNIALSEGNVQGAFTVGEYEVDYFFLDIRNYNTQAAVSFNILINEIEAVTSLDFDTENPIALPGDSTTIYSIDLPVGEYAMKISGGIANVRAYSANGVIVDEFNDDQTGRLSVYGTENIVKVYIFFVNPNSAENTVNVLVTDFAGGIELDTDKDITLSAGETVAYAMDLANGTYAITLYSTEIRVTVGNTVVVNYGDDYGEFTVNIVGAETNEILLFFTYSGTDSVTFTVSVTQA